MLKERLTSGAGLKVLFPPCFAVIVHVPTLVRWTVLPLTVQLPAATKFTGKPELAVAFTAKSRSLKSLPGSGFGLKVIVWLALILVRLKVTDGEPVPIKAFTR